jgi:FKBP-type peptidyl-prolyl cis-trans isomerase (trigger factor)
VIDQMLEGAAIRFPPALLEEALDDEVQSLERRLERRRTSLEVYLRTIPDGLTGLRKDMEPDVHRKLNRRLFLAEMVKTEDLQPPEEEIDLQLQVYRQAFKEGGSSKSQTKESFENTLRNLAANDVLARLIVRRVVDIGRGLAPELSKS